MYSGAGEGLEPHKRYVFQNSRYFLAFPRRKRARSHNLPYQRIPISRQIVSADCCNCESASLIANLRKYSMSCDARGGGCRVASSCSSMSRVPLIRDFLLFTVCHLVSRFEVCIGALVGCNKHSRAACSGLS